MSRGRTNWVDDHKMRNDSAFPSTHVLKNHVSPVRSRPSAQAKTQAISTSDSKPNDERTIGFKEDGGRASASFTLGPWHDDGFRIYAPTEDPDKRNGRVIVEYKHIEDFNYADARLIAAAPDLYEALRVIADWDREHAPGDWTLLIARIARDAIAKAS